MILRTYLENKSDTELIQVLKDYTIFENQGHIGTCKLRTIAEDYCHDILNNNDHIVLWMNQVAFESYRRFAMKYLEVKQ